MYKRKYYLFTYFCWIFIFDKKNDLTSEIIKLFTVNTSLYVYLLNITYGSYISKYKNEENGISFYNLFVANSIKLYTYYDFFLINNSVLVNKDSIPNLLIENSIIPEKNKIPCYDDTFHDGMSTDEIENVFSKILF